MATILEEIKKGRRFVIIVGGGKVCRQYQDALSKTIKANNTDLDWIGIYTTRLNAEFVRMSFEGIAENEIVLDPSRLASFTKPIIIGAGDHFEIWDEVIWQRHKVKLQRVQR